MELVSDLDPDPRYNVCESETLRFRWHVEYLNVVLDGRRPSGTPTSRLYTPRCPP